MAPPDQVSRVAEAVLAFAFMVYESFRKLGVSYFGVVKIRILLFSVLY